MHRSIDMPTFQIPIHLDVYNADTLKVIDRVVRDDDHFWGGYEIFLKRGCVRCFNCTKVYQTTRGEGVVFWDKLCADHPFGHIFIKKFNMFADDDEFDQSVFHDDTNKFDYLKALVEDRMSNPPRFCADMFSIECEAVLRAWNGVKNEDDCRLIGLPFNPFLEERIKYLVKEYSKKLIFNVRRKATYDNMLDAIKRELREAYRG